MKEDGLHIRNRTVGSQEFDVGTKVWSQRPVERPAPLRMYFETRSTPMRVPPYRGLPRGFVGISGNRGDPPALRPAQCGFHRGNHVLTAIDQHIDDGNVGIQCSDTAGLVIGSSITIRRNQNTNGLSGMDRHGVFTNPIKTAYCTDKPLEPTKGVLGLGILPNATKDGVSGIFG